MCIIACRHILMRDFRSYCNLNVRILKKKKKSFIPRRSSFVVIFKFHVFVITAAYIISNEKKFSIDIITGNM